MKNYVVMTPLKEKWYVSKLKCKYNASSKGRKKLKKLKYHRGVTYLAHPV